MLMAQNYVSAANSQGEPGLDVGRYLVIIRQRAYYLLVPFLLIAVIGTAVVFWLPSQYRAEARILVESQQIPSELVRPTITASARERIQVIEQRIMTRDNLLAIIEKFGLFKDRRATMSTTMLIDRMRDRTSMSVIELSRGVGNNLTIALAVAFEFEQPETAMRVTNEYVTLILAEDARNRSGRAQETTNFLAREVTRLEGAIVKIDTQTAEYRRNHDVDGGTDKTSVQLALLLAELQEKTSVFSDSHPEVVRLKKQLATVQKSAAEKSRLQMGLDALQSQRAGLQRQLDLATDKLSAARLGESLEHAQFSERLEVLEQAIVPQTPFKPNRKKLLAMVLAAAAAAAFASVALREAFDKTLRGPRDLLAMLPASVIVSIPVIETAREQRRKKWRVAIVLIGLLAVCTGMTFAFHSFVRPLDEVGTDIFARILAGGQ